MKRLVNENVTLDAVDIFARFALKNVLITR